LCVARGLCVGPVLFRIFVDFRSKNAEFHPNVLIFFAGFFGTCVCGLPQYTRFLKTRLLRCVFKIISCFSFLPLRLDAPVAPWPRFAFARSLLGPDLWLPPRHRGLVASSLPSPGIRSSMCLEISAARQPQSSLLRVPSSPASDLHRSVSLCAVETRRRHLPPQPPCRLPMPRTPRLDLLGRMLERNTVSWLCYFLRTCYEFMVFVDL
jgi:hypothetical protein